jgi:MSHA biogenesis protein MshQ
MIRRSRFLALFLLFLLVLPQAHAWYNASWSYRKALTVDSSQVNGTLTNFPLLVRIASDADLATKAQSSGNDLLFANSTDATLDHELEYYNTTTGQVVAWVRLPSLSNASNTTIYLYYGNSTVGSQQNKNGVWDSTYKGVWHMSNGITLSGNDSTASGNNGTLQNTPTAITGVADGAANFSGSGSDFSITDIALNGVNYSISAWFSTPLPSQTYCTLTRGSSLDHQVLTQNNILGDYDNAGTGFHSSGFDVSTLASGWHYITATTNSTHTTFYVDGIYRGIADFKSSAQISYLGNYQGGGQNFGPVDELRVSSVSRSGAQAQTEYHNQKNGSTFLTMSGAYCNAPTGLWTLNASDNCVVDGIASTVTGWTIVGNGTITIQNSNITYTNKTFSVMPGGTISIILGSGARMVRTT